MVKDPVCGMTIAPEKAADHSQYGGQTYYFCCAQCKQAFDQNPERYVAKRPETATANK